MNERFRLWAKPGFARWEPTYASRWHGKKEGAHGGTMGSPVLEHDDMNVLCLGSGVIGEDLAADLVAAFLAARFDGGERYVRRLQKIEEMEKARV